MTNLRFLSKEDLLFFACGQGLFSPKNYYPPWTFIKNVKIFFYFKFRKVNVTEKAYYHCSYHQPLSRVPLNFNINVTWGSKLFNVCCINSSGGLKLYTNRDGGMNFTSTFYAVVNLLRLIMSVYWMSPLSVLEERGCFHKFYYLLRVAENWLFDMLVVNFKEGKSF